MERGHGRKAGQRQYTCVILKEPNNTIFNNFTVTMGSGSSEKESDVFKGNGRAPWGSQILLLPAHQARVLPHAKQTAFVGSSVSRPSQSKGLNHTMETANPSVY